MKFNADYIIKVCDREIKKLEKNIKNYQKYPKAIDGYVYQLSCWKSLRDSIDFLIHNKNPYNIEEYLKFLMIARDSMVQTNLL